MTRSCTPPQPVGTCPGARAHSSGRGLQGTLAEALPEVRAAARSRSALCCSPRPRPGARARSSGRGPKGRRRCARGSPGTPRRGAACARAAARSW
eukprot:3444236-Alexandrium_andersonii.AAC.1